MIKLKTIEDKLYLAEGKLEIYTQQSWLGSITIMDGDVVETLGCALYKYYKNENDKKPTKVGVFNIPSKLKLYPTYTEQNVKDRIWEGVYSESNMNEYLVVTITEGAPVTNVSAIKSANNVVLFLDCLMGRKLDNNIPYDVLGNMFEKCCAINDCYLKAPISIMDLVVYKVCRYIKDTSKPFGAVYDGKSSPVNYTFANVRDVCAADSVFAALSFEDMNSMIDASLNMSSNNRDQNVSPLESIIKM